MDQNQIPVVTPSALVNLLANALSIDVMKQMQRVKGIYQPGKGVSYQGQYYDGLKDELTDGSITMIVPGMVRDQLNPQQVIEVTGYLTRKVQPLGARIELQLVVVELVSSEAASFQEADIQAFEILQKKRDAGYLDVDGFIKKQLLNEEQVSIKIIVGKTGIIHSDITGQLKDAIGFYDIQFVPINLSNEAEIIETLQNAEADVIAIARGGGERLDIFDKPAIAEAAINIGAYFITAIGHAQDVPLLQKVADKAFNTPTAFGQHLADIYQYTVEERSQSKAGMIEAATRQLKPLYEKQLENEREALRLAREELTSQKALHEKELTLTRESVKETVIIKRKPSVVLMIILVILSLAAGIAIAMLFLTKYIN